jgi:hypothetical protein
LKSQRDHLDDLFFLFLGDSLGAVSAILYFGYIHAMELANWAMILFL